METLGGNKGLHWGPLFESRRSRIGFWSTKKRTLVVALLLGLTIVPALEAAQAINLVAGACEFDSLTATYSPTPTLPGTVEVTLGGNGTCFVLPANGHFDASIGGTLTLLPSVPNYTCVGGTASGGTVTLSITDPDYTGLSVFTGQGTWVETPAAATLDVVSAPNYAGSGAFTRVSTDSVDCVTNGGLGPTTWSGHFAFEDPVL